MKNLGTMKTETGIKKIMYNPTHCDCHESDCGCHPESFTEPKENGIFVDAETLNSIVQQAVNDAVGKLTLDNPNTDNAGMSGGNDMLHRIRVKIDAHDNGEPIYKRVQAQTEEELTDRIVQAYIDSGRIWELMPRDAQPKTQTVFQSFAEEFRERFKTSKLKPRSLEEYDKVLFGKLIPAFGSRPIEEITTDDIQDFLNQHKTKAEKTLKNWLTVLKPILQYAVERGIISKNPADSMTLFIPSKIQTERTALTEE